MAGYKGNIEELTLKDVTKRVAGFILTSHTNTKKISPDNRPFIALNISKNDLAAYLGTIQETLSRTFRKLEEEGMIEVEGKNIYINNLKKLKETAS